MECDSTLQDKEILKLQLNLLLSVWQNQVVKFHFSLNVTNDKMNERTKRWPIPYTEHNVNILIWPIFTTNFLTLPYHTCISSNVISLILKKTVLRLNRNYLFREYIIWRWKLILNCSNQQHFYWSIFIL